MIIWEDLITWEDLVKARRNYIDHIFNNHCLGDEDTIDAFRKIEEALLKDNSITEDDCNFISYWRNKDVQKKP